VCLCEVKCGLTQIDQYYLHSIKDTHDVLHDLIPVLVLTDKIGISVICENMSVAIFVSDICHFTYTENLR
jgi:hypothetical protein